MTVTIALVGDEQPGHISHRELNAVRPVLGEDVVTAWVPTGGEQIRDLTGFDGVWVVPGSPYADDGAVYDAITWSRVHDVPFLGTCGGLQYAVIEYVRNVMGRRGSSHAESDGLDDSNVITPLACSLHGEERLVRPVPGTRFSDLVGDADQVGMHFCRYGPDPDLLADLVEAGMSVEATAQDAAAEVIELPGNGFFFLTLFQPQIGSLAGGPLHPLISEFVRQARRGSARRGSDGTPAHNSSRGL